MKAIVLVGLYLVFSSHLLATDGTLSEENVEQSNLTVMYYNVENLFDSIHDEGKNDWQYLAKGTPGKNEYCESVTNSYYKRSCFNTDWNDKKLAIKIDKTVEAILSHDGTVPDFLGLSEVENERVVHMLAKKLGYEHVYVTNSPDKRGIDVALLYKSNKRIKFKASHEHKMTSEVFINRPTRNILEVELVLDDASDISMFVNHWPSQGAPAPVRVEVAEKLKSVINAQLEKHPQKHIVAMGDFNTIESDYPHPFNSVLFAGDNALVDMHDLYQADRSISWSTKNAMPLGTYFYARSMQWNRLDRFFVSDNIVDKQGLEADVASYRIVSNSIISKEFEYTDTNNYNYGTKVKGIPFRYDHNLESTQTQGYSDHFPIVFELTMKN